IEDVGRRIGIQRLRVLVEISHHSKMNQSFLVKHEEMKRKKIERNCLEMTWKGQFECHALSQCSSNFLICWTHSTCFTTYLFIFLFYYIYFYYTYFYIYSYLISIPLSVSQH